MELPHRQTAARALKLMLATALVVFSAAEPGEAQAQDLTVGVYLPYASFASNAERSSYAQKVAKELSAATGKTVTGRALARRADVESFLNAKKVDLLVTDGLFAAGRRHTVVAHAASSSPAALFVRSGTTFAQLKGKSIALVDTGSTSVQFFTNATLAGEVVPARYFGAPKFTKDAATALNQLKAGKVTAAFAPKGHPAARGLKALVSEGAVPAAVVMVVNTTKVDQATQAAVASAFTSGAGQGGGLTGWRRGAPKDAATIAKLARSKSRVLTTDAVLTRMTEPSVTLPTIKVKPETALPPAGVNKRTVVTPELPE